jgi:hypothetical protein
MESIALGLVINPKLARPVLVVADGGNIAICRLDEDGWPYVGEGYFGDDDRATNVTGMPRSHTPRGVTEEGAGYGTCLYTALCLGAHQNSQHRGGQRPRYHIPHSYLDGDWICSDPEDRSSEADRWWETARRLRLAGRQEDEQIEEDVDVTSEFWDEIEGREYGEGKITHVNDVKVDVTTEIAVDVYPYENAQEKHLVLADFTFDLGVTPRELLWERVQAGHVSLLEEVRIDLIVGLDVRDLTLDAINLIGMLAQVGGASEDQLHDLRVRWELGLDPSSEIRQMRLPFTPNSSEGRAVRSMLAETQAIRDEAGWIRPAELP